MPAELEAGVTESRAQEIAEELRDTGADIDVIPIGEVSNVRYRASEVWPTKCVESYCFTELEGLILILSAISARENLEHLKEIAPDAKPWMRESSLNHFHPGMVNKLEEGMLLEVEAISDLIHALEIAYPEHAFTIEHIPNSQVSFWQTTDDSPKEAYIEFNERYEHGHAWCQSCGKPQAYNDSKYVDERFPKAKWGTCAECGSLVIAKPFGQLTFIEPGRNVKP